VQYIHSKSYIHRDIKPENFLIGLDANSGVIYISDFGLTKLYRTPPKGEHIPYQFGKSLTGTARYASIFSHLGCEQSRRDDLESALYVTLYFLRGDLPWQTIEPTDRQEIYKKIQSAKSNTSVEELCKGLPSKCSETV
jgi:serine/threonine protein kinase